MKFDFFSAACLQIQAVTGKGACKQALSAFRFPPIPHSELRNPHFSIPYFPIPARRRLDKRAPIWKRKK
jgi:hypothetical protein